MNVLPAQPDGEALGKTPSRPSEEKGRDLARGFEAIMLKTGNGASPSRKGEAKAEVDVAATGPERSERDGSAEPAPAGAEEAAAGSSMPSIRLAAILSSTSMSPVDATARPGETRSTRLPAAVAAEGPPPVLSADLIDTDRSAGGTGTATALPKEDWRLDLRSLVGGDIPGSQSGAQPSGRADEIAGAAIAGGSRRMAIDSTKIDLVQMRTHFEPHRRDPEIMVGTKAAADGVAKALDGALGEAGEVEMADAKGSAAARAGETRAARWEFDLGLLRPVAAKEPQQAVGPIAAPRLEGALPASPMGQIAGTVVTSLAAPASSTASPEAATESLRYRAGGAALKSIQIQLQPEHLGTVDVTMKLVRGELAIELVTSEANTARLLRDDADGLKTLLQNAGFSVEDAAISIVARDQSPARMAPPAPMDASQGSGGFGAGGQGERSSGDNNGRPERGLGERGGQDRPSPPNRDGEARRSSDPSIYL